MRVHREMLRAILAGILFALPLVVAFYWVTS